MYYYTISAVIYYCKACVKRVVPWFMISQLDKISLSRCAGCLLLIEVYDDAYACKETK